jgi:enoyl-CoA hydratase/carnithine racemase
VTLAGAGRGFSPGGDMEARHRRAAAPAAPEADMDDLRARTEA